MCSQIAYTTTRVRLISTTPFWVSTFAFSFRPNLLFLTDYTIYQYGQTLVSCPHLQAILCCLKLYQLLHPTCDNLPAHPLAWVPTFASSCRHKLPSSASTFNFKLQAEIAVIIILQPTFVFSLEPAFVSNPLYYVLVQSDISFKPTPLGFFMLSKTTDFPLTFRYFLDTPDLFVSSNTSF